MNPTLSVFQLLKMYVRQPEKLPFLLHVSIKKIFLTIIVYFCGITFLLGIASALYGWTTGDMLRTQLPAGARFYFEESSQKLRAEQVTLPIDLRFPLSINLKLDTDSLQLSRPNETPTRIQYNEILYPGQQLNLNLQDLTTDWRKSFALTFAILAPFMTFGLFFSHFIQVTFYGFMLTFVLPALKIRMDLLHSMRFALLLFIPAETIFLGASLIHLQFVQWVFDVAFWSLAIYYIWLFKRLVRNAQVV